MDPVSLLSHKYPISGPLGTQAIPRKSLKHPSGFSLGKLLAELFFQTTPAAFPQFVPDQRNGPKLKKKTLIICAWMTETALETCVSQAATPWTPLPLLTAGRRLPPVDTRLEYGRCRRGEEAGTKKK